MKFKTIFIIFISGLLWYFLSAHNSGAAFGGLGDQTGSPLSLGTCANCHNGGNFSPIVTLTLFDENGLIVNGYKPGSTYTLEINVTSGSGNAVSFGMQAVVLDDLNQNAGSFDSILTNNTRITIHNNRQYIEQDGFKADGLFRVKWTAPRYLSSNINFYVVGLVCNGLGNMEGDETSTPMHIILPPDTGFYYPKIDYCKNTGNPTPVLFGINSGGNFYSQNGLLFTDSLGTINLQSSISGNYTIYYLEPNSTQAISTEINIIDIDSVDISYSNNPFYILDGQDTVFTLDGGGCNPLFLPEIISGTGGFFYATDSNIVFIDSTTGQIDILQTLSNCGGDCGNFGLVYQSNGICPGRDTLLVRIFICVPTQNINNSKKYTIYPNPSPEKILFIKNKDNESITNVTLYNELGQVVFVEKNFQINNESLIKLRLPEKLTSTVFYLKIQDEKDFQVFKIIIE